MRIKFALYSLVVSMGLVALACGEKTEIEVYLPAVEPAPVTTPSTKAYMAIQNHTTSEKVLVGVKTQIADKGEPYTIPIAEGNPSAQKLDGGIRIPPMGRAQLDPNGDHIRLSGLKMAVKEGELIPMTLVFEDGTEILVEATVKKPENANQ